jgi:hypothetical protein
VKSWTSRRATADTSVVAALHERLAGLVQPHGQIRCAHIPVVWIVNLSTSELQCLSEPGKNGYRRRVVLQRHDLAPLSPPFATTIEVGGLF